MYANAWGSGLETAAPQNRSPGYARACQQKKPPLRRGQAFLQHFTMVYEGRTGTATLSND